MSVKFCGRVNEWKSAKGLEGCLDPNILRTLRTRPLVTYLWKMLKRHLPVYGNAVWNQACMATPHSRKVGGPF